MPDGPVRIANLYGKIELLNLSLELGGPPSHGFAGQPSTRVKQKAPDKNKPIRRNNSQELLDPSMHHHIARNVSRLNPHLIFDILKTSMCIIRRISSQER